MKRLDASSVDCFVYTFKQGVLSAVGHDLKLRVSRVQVQVDEEAGTIEATLDAHSLRVEGAMRGGQEDASLGARDRKQIERTIVDEVLHAARHPQVRFVASAVQVPPARSRVQGTLELHGVSRPVTLDVERMGDRVEARTTLHQPDFGIRPYSAMMGALKLKPDVEVVITLRP